MTKKVHYCNGHISCVCWTTFNVESCPTIKIAQRAKESAHLISRVFSSDLERVYYTKGNKSQL